MRIWVVLLALINAVFFAWTSGWVSPWLPAPWEGQREPQRQANQFKPELVAVRRLPPASAPQPASAAAPGPFAPAAPAAPAKADPAAPAASAPPASASAPAENRRR